MLTLADIQTPRFQTAAGYGTSSTEFLEIVNDVIDELIRRGDFSETVIPIRFPINYGFMTFPRWVGQVRKMKGHRQHINMRNVWWEFLDGTNRRCDWGSDAWWGWRGDDLNMEMQYRAPTFTNVPGAGNYLQFSVTEAADYGATATIFGLDSNNQPLQTLNGDGTWSQGITLAAVNPYAQSTVFVSAVERVVLSATNSTKTLSAYNPTTAVTTQLAVYQANETNPSFLRYKLVGGNGFWCNNSCPQSAVILVKLANLPVLNPTDLIIINNRGALLDGIRAVKLEDAEDASGSILQWKKAVEKLNRQLENDEPEDQFSAANNTFGDSGVGHRIAF